MNPGKLRGLGRLADHTGVFRMLAVDQRPPVQKLIAERRGVDVAPHDDMMALKHLLAEELGAEASAVLVDPLTTFPAGDRLDPHQGLVMTLEDATFDETSGGRRSKWIDDWTVDQIKRAGADGVKLLAWYRPDASPEVVEHQQQFVERTGDACARADIPFIFELLLYPFPGQLGASGPVGGTQRAELVLESLEAFAPSRFGVDMFKVESPYLPDQLPPRDQDGGFHQAVFDDIERVVNRPWVLLSGGADRNSFLRVLEYAYAAGASGFLAGRSIWWDAASHFPDLDRVRTELRDDAVPYMRRVNELTTAHAAPLGARGLEVGGRPGPDFCRSYRAVPEPEFAQ